MTGFWGVTKWGQTRDKLNWDVTKFLTHARNRTTTRFVKVGVLSQFCPRCDKFCHNSLIHQSIYHISYRNGDFVMTNFVLSLSHLICVMINFVQFLSSVCHILYVLWQNLSNFCPQFVTSYMCYDKICPIFVPSLSHFLDFYTFLCIKCIFWYFVPFLSHGTNFVTFLTPQKPSNTKGFRVWSKICHICPNFVPSLSRVCHAHKPRGYAVYT